MSTFSWLGRSWIFTLVPAAVFLSGCDETPTEAIAPPVDAARGGGGKVTLEKIAFASDHQGAFSLYLREFDGYDVDKRITTPGAGEADAEPDFAPGNKSLVFTRYASGQSELYSVGLKGGRPPRQLTSFGGLTQHPVYSPDGQKIAFVSDKDGSPDVYVMNADGSNVQRVTNTPVGDYHPTWSPDGSRLAYASAEYQVATTIRSLDTSTWASEILLDCPTTWCTSPTWSRTGNRIMYEESVSFGSAPALKLLDLDAGTNTAMPGYPSARVGGWKPNGTRFVFATTGLSELYTADTQTMAHGQFYSVPSPTGTIITPTWSR